MSDTFDLGASLSPEENAFFESGGNSAIPPDTGSDSAGGDSGATAADGSEGQAGDKGADTGKAGGEKAPSTVPLAALQEERTKRQAERTKREAIDQTLRETQTQLAELRGKFSIVERLGLPQDNQQEAKGPPTPEEDIFGNVKHVGETVVQLQKRLDDQDAAAKVATEQTAFVNNYRADAAKFEATTPDFKAGYNFLLNARAEELKAIGYDTPQALHEALIADEYAIADMAFKKGKSPSEMLYALAKQRGYKTAPGPDGAKDITPSKGAERLDTIERGQNANKSLSNTGGSSGDPEMTAEALINMSLEDFEAWSTKNPAKARRIMGG